MYAVAEEFGVEILDRIKRVIEKRAKTVKHDLLQVSVAAFGLHHMLTNRSYQLDGYESSL